MVVTNKYENQQEKPDYSKTNKAVVLFSFMYTSTEVQESLVANSEMIQCNNKVELIRCLKYWASTLEKAEHYVSQ